MRFLVDECTGPAVAQWLRRQNHDVVFPQSEAEERRGFDPSGVSPREKAKNASRFFPDTLFKKVKEFNPKFKDTLEELLRKINLPLPTIAGNRDFLKHLQGEKTFFSKEENREFNLVLINYEEPGKNVYEVTEEYYLFNGQYANREDVVFLINGIPVLVSLMTAYLGDYEKIEEKLHKIKN